MVTLKLNKSTSSAADKRRDTAEPRGPVRGAGSAPRTRPTLAQSQDQRAEREARYEDQLRQRFGNNAPPAFHRDAAPEPRGRSVQSDPRQESRQAPREQARSDPRQEQRTDRQRAPQRDAWPAHQQNRGAAPRQERQPDARDSRDSRDSRGQSQRNTAFEPRYQNQQQHPAPRPSNLQQAWQPQPPTDFRDRNARDNRAPDQAQPWRDAPPQRRGPQRSPNAAPPQYQPFNSPGATHSTRGRNTRHRDEEDDDFDHAPVAEPGSMRLSKRMSELGISSRREADEWIPKGWVRVDGRVVSELGSRVLPSQQITVDAKAKFVQAQKVTVILNKPVGYVSGQAEDGYEPAVVLIKPANQWREDQSGTRYLLTHLRGIAPAGRLDIDSVGLLVLTQDGRIAKQLIGEDSEMEKEYLVRVEKPEEGLSDSNLALLNHGLELDGEALRPALVEWINEDQLRFVLKEGKKRQIRRMCEAVGLKVTGLKRVRIGNVMLGDLPAGEWRYLRGDESFVPLKPPTSE
jgi:23S rRNA pseudouridine2604 synthase